MLKSSKPLEILIEPITKVSFYSSMQRICIIFAYSVNMFFGMTKNKRQQKIINLISASNIATQEQLTKSLSEAGFDAAQSSVSRDLTELGVIKIGGFYSTPSNKNARFGFVELESAGENLIIAKCESGLASAVAVQIDRARIVEIVGTIAGDDTIFIAVKDAKTQKSAVKKIWELFGEQP